jgi:hypothetical protein
VCFAPPGFSADPCCVRQAILAAAAARGSGARWMDAASAARGNAALEEDLVSRRF